jgi:hypothetical protein
VLSSRSAHRRRARRSVPLAVAGLLGALLLGPPGAAQAAAPLQADVTFGSSVVSSNLHGRVYLMARPGTNRDPLSGLGADGDTVLFGKDLASAAPGQTVPVSGGGNGNVFDGVYGFPQVSLDELPSGTYTVRAFFNVYETARRSDGSVVDVHFPCGDGGNPFRSPGNLQSAMRTITIDRDAATTVPLTLDTKLVPSATVPPGGTCQQGNFADSAHVKHVKIKSDVLSKFWGRDMYVAADVLLPWDYDDAANAGKRYPVVYSQGHYPSAGAPFGFTETSTNALSTWWRNPANPKLIGVQFRTENPFYDDSYVVNSPNLGPYGDAVNDELIPKLDAMFRTIARPYARALTGGSTGGWITVANQVFRPDLFGSAWSGYPDSLDFNAHQTVDLYNAPSAYYEADGSVIPSSHSYNTTTGVDTIELTMPQENHYELAVGTHSRSQVGQWDVWNAVYGGQGSDCYPDEPWDKVTGVIDRAAVEKWKPMDMSEVLTARWATLGPVLRDKLHIWVGTQDTYYLNEGVKAFQDTVERLSGSTSWATFTYGPGAPHGYTPYASTSAMLTDIYNYITAHTPAAGVPDPDLSYARGNLWADVSANGCARTTAPGTPVGGSVPATLSLTLSGQPAFGAFTAGVGRDYTATTTATVTSSAGDAALIVQDTSPFFTNRLVNGSFALAQELRVKNNAGVFQTMPAGLKFWGGPTASEAVPVELRQTIGANEPLRSGSYAKTLTFTLSTTTP